MSHPEETTMITEQHHSQDRREALPDPEVVPKAQRRKYSATYKLRILQDVEVCTEPGQVGALLRQEGLYSSHLTRWRQQMEQGKLASLTPQKRGRKGPDDQEAELSRLHQEIEQLQQRLQQAELIMAVQKKLSQLLGLMSNATGKGESR